jgi:Protein of unknown function (DUF2480)
MNETEDIILNKVANSGLVTLDLEDLYQKGDRILYDLKENLFMGMILREKDFREFLKTHDLAHFKGKYVAITCSEDVIIPTWAYMLLATKLQPIAQKVVFGNLENLENVLFLEAINKIDIEQYRDAKVVVKGCSKVPVPASAYVHVTNLLMPVAQSIMFGEPCSTVPLYKRPKI